MCSNIFLKLNIVFLFYFALKGPFTADKPLLPEISTWPSIGYNNNDNKHSKRCTEHELFANKGMHLYNIMF